MSERRCRATVPTTRAILMAAAMLTAPTTMTNNAISITVIASIEMAPALAPAPPLRAVVIHLGAARHRVSSGRV
jgi:hypothetical protein